MSSEERLELSVQETNKLRAELGLAPLRGTGAAADEDNKKRSCDDEGVTGGDAMDSGKPQQDDKEVLELSVDATNQLREKLGLPPLRDVTFNVQDVDLKEKERQEEEARLEEKEQLKEDVERGIESTFTAKSLGEEASNDVSSWAAKLRKTDTTATDKKKKKTKKKKTKQDDDEKYDESDLKGMAVSHAASELQAGSTTVMTLADAPLLETNEHNARIVTGLNEDANTPQLENINLAEAAKQSDGLKKKRQLEMGLGRAGGYAGYDDDEFEELGGTGAPSRRGRGDGTGTGGGEGVVRKGRGFQIGSVQDEERGGNDGSDLFAMENGNAISLEPSQADVQASDFMTEQEDLELRGKDKKKSKKKDKFDKKKKKKDKKEKRKHRRRQEEDDDESEEEVPKLAPVGTKTLLQELEETADDNTANTKGRKRVRGDDDAENGEVDAPLSVPSASILSKAAKKENKRAKYDAIMDKGNVRTQQAFSEKKNTTPEEDILDDEPDDAFLNAAMAKARRLKKLRGMNGGSGGAPGARGAAAVAAAVSAQTVPDGALSSATTTGGITFSVDDTREFTRALQARSEQQSRKQAKVDAQKNTPANTISTVKKVKEENTVETVKQEDNNDGDDDEDVAMEDMEELAKEIKDDGNNTGTFLDGTTGNTMSVGRGLAGVLNLFQQTGELTRKNAGKEELRGRAKDHRNYEDYEKLDLKSVVKIDERYATDKDREFANREIKLEYRDKHGRLLAKKEAYRDLCYQFHGHGSSKKNEERRQKQMARDQAEGRLASQQLGGADGGPGMLGALKATQKATGKAFVVHKTGN